jgi:hypothetical protein
MREGVYAVAGSLLAQCGHYVCQIAFREEFASPGRKIEWISLNHVLQCVSADPYARNCFFHGVDAAEGTLFAHGAAIVVEPFFTVRFANQNSMQG